MAQESGTLVSLRYVRERTRGTTPAGVGTPVTSVATDATGVGVALLTRSTGSFETDGFLAGQWVRLAGFAAAPNNADWRIRSVDSATQITLEDPSDVIATETAEVGQS